MLGTVASDSGHSQQVCANRYSRFRRWVRLCLLQWKQPLWLPELLVPMAIALRLLFILPQLQSHPLQGSWWRQLQNHPLHETAKLSPDFVASALDFDSFSAGNSGYRLSHQPYPLWLGLLLWLWRYDLGGNSGSTIDVDCSLAKSERAQSA